MTGPKRRRRARRVTARDLRGRRITGRDVREIREQLGLDQFPFAAMLGVAPSTVYRWESRGCNPACCDPLHERILYALAKRLVAATGRESTRFIARAIETRPRVGRRRH